MPLPPFHQPSSLIMGIAGPVCRLAKRQKIAGLCPRPQPHLSSVYSDGERTRPFPGPCRPRSGRRHLGEEIFHPFAQAGDLVASLARGVQDAAGGVVRFNGVTGDTLHRIDRI